MSARNPPAPGMNLPHAEALRRAYILQPERLLWKESMGHSVHGTQTVSPPELPGDLVLPAIGQRQTVRMCSSSFAELGQKESSAPLDSIFICSGLSRRQALC